MGGTRTLGLLNATTFAASCVCNTNSSNYRPCTISQHHREGMIISPVLIYSWFFPLVHFQKIFLLFSTIKTCAVTYQQLKYKPTRLVISGLANRRAASGTFGTPRIGIGRATPCRLLAAKFPAKYRDRQKNVSPLWRRYGPFLSPHGFYFCIWRCGERLARAQHVNMVNKKKKKIPEKFENAFFSKIQKKKAGGMAQGKPQLKFEGICSMGSEIIRTRMTKIWWIAIFPQNPTLICLTVSEKTRFTDV